MLRILSLSAVAVFLVISSFAQTIHRVNNLPGAAAGINTYATIAGAVEAADNGDIIYIEPTVTAHAGATVDKTLHFIGNGNFLALNPNTPAQKATSLVVSLTFAAGSDNSTVTGLQLSGSLTITDATGIQIKRNRLNNTLQLNNNTSGILIQGNYMSHITGNGNSSSGVSTTIKNNIILTGIVNLQNSLITNNSIYWNNGIVITNCQASTIVNNILFHPGYTTVPNYIGSNPSSSFSNNLMAASYSTLPSPNPDGNDNVYTDAPGVIFRVANPQSTGWDADFQLAEVSPAKGIGTGGSDVGAFSGVTPYTLSTLPPVPIITTVTTSGAGNASVPLQVTITLRGNN